MEWWWNNLSCKRCWVFPATYRSTRLYKYLIISATRLHWRLVDHCPPCLSASCDHATNRSFRCSVIVVLMRRKEAERILNKASALGQTGKDFMWILSKSAINEKSQAFYPGLLGKLYTRVIVLYIDVCPGLRISCTSVLRSQRCMFHLCFH